MVNDTRNPPEVVDVIAHRAGNNPADARAAAAAGHTIELDVHAFRGRLEVRHEKVLWPTARLWDRWYMLPAGTKVATLTEILDAAGPAALLVDVKSPGRATARRIANTLEGRERIVVSSRMWWTLGVFRGRPGWITLRSCGNRLQLWIAMRLPRAVNGHGIAVHERRLTPDVADRLTGRADLLYVWGARSRDRCEQLLTLGVSGLILDDVELMPNDSSSKVSRGRR